MSVSDDMYPSIAFHQPIASAVHAIVITKIMLYYLWLLYVGAFNVISGTNADAAGFRNVDTHSQLSSSSQDRKKTLQFTNRRCY